MKGEEVNTARPVTARIEPSVELDDECGGVTVERIGQRDEAGQVGLAHELTLAQRVGGPLEPARVQGGGAHGLSCRTTAPRESANKAAGSVPRQERCALERDAGVVQQLLEVGQAGIRAAEDRNVLERTVEPT